MTKRPVHALRARSWGVPLLSALLVSLSLLATTRSAFAVCPVDAPPCPGAVGCCSTGACCGKLCYDDSAGEQCCGSVVCSAGEGCCGSKCYSPSVGQFCCGGTAVCSAGQTCCGSTCINAGEVCCANAGDICRPAQGECDVAEVCPSAGVRCPADQKAPATTACSTDNNPCTVDQCDGTSNDCQHPVGNPGTVCRPSHGDCDPAETCTGSSAACPPDAKSSGPCRVAAGPCDVAESCDGVNDNCPTDQFLEGGGQHQCSDPSCTNGVATLASFCSGSSAQCPQAQTQTCSPATCANNQCAGCTDDTQCPSTQYCSAGVCVDKLKKGATCSKDSQCELGHCVDTVCCESACDGGICDSCNLPSSAGSCLPVAADTICRDAAGECDEPETCGGATQCPADKKKGSLVSCTDDDDPCTLDQCDGVSNACQHTAALLDAAGCAGSNADGGVIPDGSAPEASVGNGGDASTARDSGRADVSQGDAQNSLTDSSSDSPAAIGDGEDDGTYPKESFGACTCNLTAPAPPAAPPIALGAALAALWYTRRKRRARSRDSAS